MVNKYLMGNVISVLSHTSAVAVPNLFFLLKCTSIFCTETTRKTQFMRYAVALRCSLSLKSYCMPRMA